ncbi:hypothetical protein CLOM_g21047 [Closterium sp. NIES-68]|nr:hypothetical protein CLOM_g21047 [Closterium sp. NIES-68]GJP62587.1 hypothetical protein CLOP_g19633 [Closterium sp. NIES-67]
MSGAFTTAFVALASPAVSAFPATGPRASPTAAVSAAAMTSASASVLMASRHSLKHPLSGSIRRKGQQAQLRDRGVQRRNGGVVVMASGQGESGQGRGETEEKRPLFIKDDGPYFAKAFGGCVAGAIAIKYGSLFIVPQLTESPSPVAALTIILTPVVVAAILLAYASSRSD